VSLIERLDRPVADRLRAVGEPKELDAGDFLVHDGADPLHVFVVERGLLKIVKSSLDGDVSFIGLRRPGTLVGELAVLTGDVRSSSVQAIESSTVTAIEARRFDALLGELPELANELLRETATGLRDATVQLHCLMTADATTRIADRLVHLVDDSAGWSGDHSTIQLPVSQEELGEWAGLSRAAAVKALRSLRRSGVIETGRMKIAILDLDRLCDVAAI